MLKVYKSRSIDIVDRIRGITSRPKNFTKWVQHLIKKGAVLSETNKTTTKQLFNMCT